ncbi:MAG TPA: 3D-(3,5/4)-trihydroxycyclohexane-1,2-dione acylhydrolase (decyclizing) [Acetobacteraceae bacterium]|nr:3D-(3,5/4)-trihydroxycyclohexane-1,2-dione acylhydrolase (decyclizing) [Acetobacteraceae bacterium]
MSTVRLTAAQAVVRYLAAQRTERGEGLFAGVWAIFGHGNVAGLGEALHLVRDALPTFRAHNEQGMALAAAAFAKASNRRRMMACTSSIGPGATNMITAAAVAHVNRLPVLFLPGDVFASRRPDPVLQQTEDWGDPTASVNDCFRPVSRYFDRVTRPEQLVDSLPNAIRVLTDPAQCGPATLSLCQDVQAEAFEYPSRLFEPVTHYVRRPGADAQEKARAVAMLREAKRPLIVAGGGVLYSEAAPVLAALASRWGVPVAETQAGKGALAWDHAMAVGGIGVTGSSAANTLAREADLVFAIGTRLQDFTTGSRALLRDEARMLHLNVLAFDAAKHGGVALVGDARRTLEELAAALPAHGTAESWRARVRALVGEWTEAVDAATAPPSGNALPSDAQVIGAVNRAAQPDDVVVCAAGGLPGELHKLWRAAQPGGYHLEYGYSCMGYEITGGLGVRMARTQGEVFVMVGDGSYLMLNSELQTSVLLGRKLIVTVLDNGGFGCINRLQQACGGPPFNNLVGEPGWVDFAAHARALGCEAEQVDGVAALEAALARARGNPRTSVIVIRTDPAATTQAGGAWWDVAVPEVSARAEVRAARAEYAKARA